MSLGSISKASYLRSCSEVVRVVASDLLTGVTVQAVPPRFLCPVTAVLPFRAGNRRCAQIGRLFTTTPRSSRRSRVARQGVSIRTACLSAGLAKVGFE